MKWFLKVVQNYAVFNGRARRKEYWMYALFYAIFYIAAVIIDVATGSMSLETGVGLVTVLYSLALFLPSLGVLVRRLHDTNRSGWWVLLAFVPLIGGIVVLIFTLLDGTSGDNEYGADPKQANQ